MSVAEGTHVLQHRSTWLLRSGVNKTYKATGNHGFDFVFAAKPGRHTYCMTATNVGPGSAGRLCTSLTVLADRPPIGEIESVTRVNGNLVANGWVYDPNNPAYSVDIHLSAADPGPHDGYGDATAGLASPDINSKYHITGQHRFAVKLSAGAEMETVVCATGRDLGPGYPLNGHLGCATAPTMDGQPVGRAQATGGTGVVHLTGFAYDPDQPGDSLTLKVTLNLGPFDNYPADKPSPDFNATYGITGDHGFSIDVPTTAGLCSIEIVIYNVGSGRDATVYQGSVTVR